MPRKRTGRPEPQSDQPAPPSARPASERLRRMAADMYGDDYDDYYEPPAPMVPVQPPRGAPPSRQGGGLTFDQRLDIGGILLFIIGLLIFAALLSPNRGVVIGRFVDLIAGLVGWGMFIVPVLFMIIGIWIWVRHFGDRLPRIDTVRVAGLLSLIVAILIAMHSYLRTPTPQASFEAANNGLGGGLIGAYGLELLISWFGWSGMLITLGAWFLIATMVTLGISTQDLYYFSILVSRRLRGQGPPGQTDRRQRTEPRDDPDITDEPEAVTAGATAPPASSPRPRYKTPTIIGGASDHTPAPPGDDPADEKPQGKKPARSSRKRPEPATETRTDKKDSPRPATRPVAAAPAKPASDAPSPLRIGGDQVWRLPDISRLLDEGTEAVTDDKLNRERVQVIEDTLESFGAPGSVVEINPGPVITQFGIQPGYLTQRSGKTTKVKVSKITGLADDLALALSASAIRIEAPVPGKGYVGVEVPNAESTVVTLRDVMETEAFTKIKTSLGIALGQNVAGEPVAADLSNMPHLLIAGTTGSGKSVCVNAIIAALLLTNTPDDLKFLMVDPKRVELTNYRGLPHMLVDVVVDLERVVGALQWVSREMDNRYSIFAREGVRNITELNRKARSRNDKKMPYLVVIIDELADLMMLAPEETEKIITRLAQMARATGIHLVIATQRPSVDVVTGLIKANFPARISFAVASSIDSRVVLDQPGAEKLLGRGDMLFQSPDAAQPVRIQGVFVSDDEINRLVRYWKGAFVNVAGKRATTEPAAPPEPASAPMPAPASRPAVPPRAAPPPASAPEASSAPQGAPPARPTGPQQQPLWGELTAPKNFAPEPAASDEDDLLDEAISVVRDMRKASISLLQRRLRIGYTRAARIIDILEERGIVGPAKTGAQQREVLDYGEDAPDSGMAPPAF